MTNSTGDVIGALGLMFCQSEQFSPVSHNVLSLTRSSVRPTVAGGRCGCTAL